MAVEIVDFPIKCSIAMLVHQRVTWNDDGRSKRTEWQTIGPWETLRNCHILSAPWPSDSCVDARVAPACGYNRLEKKMQLKGKSFLRYPTVFQFRNFRISIANSSWFLLANVPIFLLSFSAFTLNFVPTWRANTSTFAIVCHNTWTSQMVGIHPPSIGESQGLCWGDRIITLQGFRKLCHSLPL